MTPRSLVDVIVVGAGHNGLISACYLARAGLNVLVVEAHETAGGMTATNPIIPEAPDHMINEGSVDATLFRASGIEAELRLQRFGLRQNVLDPMHAYLDPDGGSLCLWRDPQRTAEEIRRFSPRDARAWIELARTLDAAIDLVMPVMLTNPTRPALGNLVKALRIGRHRREIAPFLRILTASLAEIVCERFEHPYVRAPLAGLTIFQSITNDETGWILIYLGLIHRYGLGRFVGGTGALPKALTACLESHGGRVRTSSPVDELLVDAGRVVGVRLATGEELRARATIGACSPKTTLTRLLPRGVLSDEMQVRADHIPTSHLPATFLKLDVAAHGRIDLPRHHEWRRDDIDLRVPISSLHPFDHYLYAWDAVALGKLPTPIPCLATVPSAADPTQAPAGQDTFWFYSGCVPIRPEEPWEELGDRALDAVIEDASKYYEGIDELAIGRRILTPPRLAERFWAIDGNVFHVDPYVHRHGPLRPGLGFGGYKTPVPGLFLTGAGTHPSAGICGVSGKLSAQAVLRDLSP